MANIVMCEPFELYNLLNQRRCGPRPAEINYLCLIGKRATRCHHLPLLRGVSVTALCSVVKCTNTVREANVSVTDLRTASEPSGSTVTLCLLFCFTSTWVFCDSVLDASEAQDYCTSHIITAKNAKMVRWPLAPQLMSVCINEYKSDWGLADALPEFRLKILPLFFICVFWPGLKGSVPSSRAAGGWQHAACGGLWQQHRLPTGARLECVRCFFRAHPPVFYTALYFHCCARRRKQAVSCLITGRANACAHVLAKASLNPVRIVRGGFQRFSALYPFLRTEKILYTIMVKNKILLFLNPLCSLG